MAPFVRVVEVGSGNEFTTWTPKAGLVKQVLFSPDGRLLVAGYREGML